MKDRLTVSLLSFIAGALAILLARSLFAPTPAHAQGGLPLAEVGRFVPIVSPGFSVGNATYSPTLYIVDTQTSQTWSNNSHTWSDEGIPTVVTRYQRKVAPK